jgi:hypothetical protein
MLGNKVEKFVTRIGISFYQFHTFTSKLIKNNKNDNEILRNLFGETFTSVVKKYCPNTIFACIFNNTGIIYLDKVFPISTGVFGSRFTTSFILAIDKILDDTDEHQKKLKKEMLKRIDHISFSVRNNIIPKENIREEVNEFVNNSQKLNKIQILKNFKYLKDDRDKLSQIPLPELTRYIENDPRNKEIIKNGKTVKYNSAADVRYVVRIPYKYSTENNNNRIMKYDWKVTYDRSEILK